MGSTAWAKGKPFQVLWVAGGSTNLTVRLEHCLSTGLGSTAIRDLTVVYTPSNQSPQYVTTVYIEPGDRLRVRVENSITGNASAKIMAEPTL